MSENDSSSWTSEHPLAGRTIVVTRAREQAGALAEPLESLGADVVSFPVIAITGPEDWGPVDAAIARLEEYDWVVFTSTNAVGWFFARLSQHAGDVRPLAGKRIAAVGTSTERRIARSGLEIELVPDDARAEGLIDAFEEVGVEPGCRVLIPRAARAREILPEWLREHGAFVDVVTVYRTVPVEPDRALIERIVHGSVDVVTFTSGSTVKHFIAALGSAGVDSAAIMDRALLASIGPVTTAALERRGYHADVEAPEATMAALAEAVAAHFSASDETP